MVNPADVTTCFAGPLITQVTPQQTAGGDSGSPSAMEVARRGGGPGEAAAKLQRVVPLPSL